MAIGETARLLAELGLKNNFSPTVNKALSDLGRLEKRTDRIGSIAARGFGNASRNVQRFAAIGIAGAAGIGVAAVKAAVDWETAFTGVRKTVDATEGEFKDLEAGLKSLAATKPLDLIDLAAIAEQAGAMGIAKDQILDFTETVAVIGTTTNVSVDAAAEALGKLGNVFGLTGDEYSRFASTLVDLGNKGASTEDQILELTKRIAGAGAVMGLTVAETQSMAAAIANVGINTEAGGTSFSRLSNKIGLAVADGGKQLKLLGKASGLTGEQFAKMWEQNPASAWDSLISSLGKMTGKQRSATLAALGFSNAYDRDLILRLAAAEAETDNITKTLATGTAAWEENSAAAAEAEKRYATTASQLQLLRNNAKLAGITIGSELLPAVTEASKRIVALLQANPQALKGFGQSLSRAFTTIFNKLDKVDWNKLLRGAGRALNRAVDVLDKLPWGAIGDAFRLMGAGAKAALDLFLSAPPWLQTAVLTGWGLNKLTGGALTGIFGELAKGLVKGVLGINAGVVNINAAKVVGGGSGPGVPAAAAAAGGIGLAGIASAIAVGVGGALAQNELNAHLSANNMDEFRTQGAQLFTNPIAQVQGAINGVKFAVKAVEMTLGKNLLGGKSSSVDTQPGKQKDDAAILLKTAFSKPLGVSLDPAIERALVALRNPKSTDRQVVKSLDMAIAAIKDGAVIDDKGYHTLEGTLRQRVGRAIERGDMQQARKLEAQLASIRRVRETMANGNQQTKSGLSNVVGAVDRKKLQVRVNQKQNQTLTATAIANSSGAKAAGGADDTYVRKTQSSLQNIDRYLAAGAVGIATKPVRAVFGEAGNEAFAILRNPRGGTLGGGEHVVNVTVNIDPRRITKKQTSSGIYKTFVAT